MRQILMRYMVAIRRAIQRDNGRFRLPPERHTYPGFNSDGCGIRPTVITTSNPNASRKIQQFAVSL
jgi:hypothetical protein